MSVLIQQVKEFPVTVGDVTLYLSSYQISGGCQLVEQGSADGSAVVTSFWVKGSQISLQGRLAGNPENAVIALDALARSRVGISLQIGEVSCAVAYLIGYTLKDNQNVTEISVTFYSASPLIREELP